MATADRDLSSFYPWHVTQCQNKPCVFGCAAYGSRKFKISFFNKPELIGDYDVPDSYRPGHGLIIKLYPHRHIEKVDVASAGNPYYEWNCREAEFKIVCNCKDPQPHDWMFSLFCTKYHICVQNFMF